MANVLHSSLTGANLHKPLGAKEVGYLDLTQTSSTSYAIRDNDSPKSSLIRIDKTGTSTTSIVLGQVGGTRANNVQAPTGIILAQRSDPGSQSGFNRVWVYGKDVSGTARLFCRDESGEHQITPAIAATDVLPALTEEAIPHPFIAGMGTSVGTRVLSAVNMECSLWYIPRPFTFNRFIWTLGGAPSGSPTQAIALYQYTDGAQFKSATPVPRILLISGHTIAGSADGDNESATVASTALVAGYYYLAVGRASGTSITVRGFVGATNANWMVPAAGSLNVLFNSGSPGTPSTSLDLTTVTGNVNNQSMIHRFKFV